jgi:outer membrane protein assembly factor BamD (BamD/ComL family)
MSIAGIASSLLSQIGNRQNNQRSQIQTEFQQLAQDLKAGNLSQAQSDFAALQQNAPTAQANSNSPLSQAFSALGKDLQSGNLSAAQQDFATIQQDISSAQQGAQQNGQVRHHHHHAAESQSSQSASGQPSTIAQIFNTLGQDLQSGNLSSAQQAYAALQQDLQQLGGSFSSSGTALPSASSSVSLSA